VTRPAYVFRADLAATPGVSRTIELGGDHTLEDLHEVLRAEFCWADPHLYSFWLGGEFWGGSETEYTAPDGVEESDAKSAEIPLRELGLETEQRIAYVFDYGDNWEVELTVAEIRDAGDESLPRVVERRGEAPPQYERFEGDEE
jgi:Plasmid pRiA4b ORF-3-like protein